MVTCSLDGQMVVVPPSTKWFINLCLGWLSLSSPKRNGGSRHASHISASCTVKKPPISTPFTPCGTISSSMHGEQTAKLSIKGHAASHFLERDRVKVKGAGLAYPIYVPLSSLGYAEPYVTRSPLQCLVGPFQGRHNQVAWNPPKHIVHIFIHAFG